MNLTTNADAALGRLERLVMPDFKREPRYMVFKVSDVEKYLDDDMTKLLHYIGRTLQERRVLDGKEPIACVVVEHDWPEYEPTWKAIEARMTS